MNDLKDNNKLISSFSALLNEDVYKWHNGNYISDFEKKLLEAILEKASDDDELNDLIKDGDVHELADESVDIYNSDLIKWLSEDVNNIDFCNTAVHEFSMLEASSFDLIKVISSGQYLYYIEAFNDVISEMVKDIDVINGEESSEE